MGTRARRRREAERRVSRWFSFAQQCTSPATAVNLRGPFAQGCFITRSRPVRKTALRTRGFFDSLREWPPNDEANARPTTSSTAAQTWPDSRALLALRGGG